MVKQNNTLSVAAVRYLILLYEMDTGSEGVHSTDLAERLHVTKPSVYTMIKKFAQKGYVTQVKYEAIHLTGDGKRLAEQYMKCFDTLYDFMQTLLRLPPEDGRNAACAVLAETDIDELELLYSKLSNVENAV